jgi:hypothetical protein
VGYLITFACCGSHLHGEYSLAVDRHHNLPGTPFLEIDPERARAERLRMDQSPYSLDPKRRRIVLQAIREVCSIRNWSLLAAHVRTNHVHTVIEADERPEKIMNAFKS